jgi:hypothetical protein
LEGEERVWRDVSVFATYIPTIACSSLVYKQKKTTKHPSMEISFPDSRETENQMPPVSQCSGNIRDCEHLLPGAKKNRFQVTR